MVKKHIRTIASMCSMLVVTGAHLCFGQFYWKKEYVGGVTHHLSDIKPTSDSNFLLLCDSYSRDGGSTTFLISVIADQYASKNKLFSYKIPTGRVDTLNFAYVPLKVPSGMTVSAGGTVSWKPETDSIYTDHAEFLVKDDMGRKDTLTFNIFVNDDLKKLVSSKYRQINNASSKKFEITLVSFPGSVRFSIPPFSVAIDIYDVTGRNVDRIVTGQSSSGSSFSWPGNVSSCTKFPVGRYLAKVVMGKNSVVKSFVLVR